MFTHLIYNLLLTFKHSNDRHLRIVTNIPVSQLSFPWQWAARTTYISLWAEQPTAVCITIFHKYCCYIIYGGNIRTLLYGILGGMLLVCQNTTVWVYGAWIKKYYILCSKINRTLWGLFLFPTGSWWAGRGTRICKTRLFILSFDNFSMHT